jgi:hypothetical protein
LRIERLGAGDELVELKVSKEARAKDPSMPDTWRMRAIRYQRRGFKPQLLLTSMLDPRRFPVDEIVALYHERWEIELGYNEVKRVMLEGGQCYALAAVGDADVEDIDLRLLSIADSASLVASDVTRQRDAVVKVCPDRAAVYVLDIRMYRGAGSYVVQSFGLDERSQPLPPGIDSSTRIPYAEVLARLEARGMRAVPVVWGLLQPEATQAIPLQLHAGRCYAVGAVAGADVAGGDLDMSLVDVQGRLLAAEIGPSPNPLVFHCAERDETVRAVMQAHEIRRPARFLLLLGEDAQVALAEVIR